MKFFLTVTDKLTPHSHMVLSSGPDVVEFDEEAYSSQYFQRLFVFSLKID